MNKFNLTFSGEILAGHDPAQVRLRFGKLFAINDPVRLETFFSGQTVILRRNLERKEAARYYHELHLLGMVPALAKVTTSDVANAVSALPPPPSQPDAENSTANQATVMPEGPQSVPNGQTWAVSSRVAPRSPHGKKAREAKKAAAPKKPPAARRDKADIAAGLKARKKDTLHLATEKEAEEHAALEANQRAAAEADALEVAEKQRPDEQERQIQEVEQQRQAVEQQREATERQPREAERQRQGAERQQQKEQDRARRAEEASRKAAEAKAQKAAERARQQAEKAAQREAEREEAKRRRAEEAARQKAEKAEARRIAAAEAARQKAALREQEKAERARIKAEEAARRKAELAEKKRREAEEAARLQAEQEEKKRLEAEEAARQQAEQEMKRRAAEEVARLQAELEEIRRREAEEAARLQAELEEIKRQEAEAAATLQAEQEERERQAAAEAARIKEEAQRKQAEAQRQSAQRRRAVAEELSARRAARKNQNINGLARLAVQDSAAIFNIPLVRKRQPGEPNLYQMRPFRNTDEVRSRAAQAQQRMRQSFTVAVLALSALLIAGGIFLRQTAVPVLTGATAVAVDPGAGPLLLAGDALLLHDRAGVSTKELPLRALGVEQLQAPLAFDNSGALLAPGRLSDRSANGNDVPQLLRCELPASTCRQFSPELQGSNIGAFAVHPLDGSLILADTANGQLLKVDRDGKLLARAAVTLPPRPVLRLHGGLLLMNSAEGPAISVLRYENNAFGQQLDEILLLPPTAQQAGQTGVDDFLWSGNAWWASLYDAESGNSQLYRFDEEWNYLDQAVLPGGASSLQLANWGEKTLVSDPHRLPIERFNAQGAVEAPFISKQLQELIRGQQHRANLTALAWRGGLLACAVAAALGFALGFLHRLRKRVYTLRGERGAEPVDDYVDSLQWIEPVKERPALLRRRGIGYGLLALAVLLLAIAQNVTVWQLVALLLILSGPAIALILLNRQPVGHIGVLRDRLLLVDHGGMYHLAGGASVQYRGPFLLIDDVVVFAGTRLLPAFSTPQLQKLVMPLARGGVKADRSTVLVKLLQRRHPLALGACAMVAAMTAASVLLGLY